MHVYLPAEPDDRLLRGAVSVVFEPLTVEGDQPLEVLLGPEDVVREEAVAVVRGLLGDLRGADGAVPDKRGNAVERPRRRREALQGRAELALPVHDILAPESVKQCVVLDGKVQALADVLSEPRINRARIAATEDEVSPAT